MILFKLTWFAGRYLRQLFCSAYIRTIGSFAFRKVGKGVVFDGIPDIVTTNSHIIIGDNVRIGRSCVFYSSGCSKISIGSETTINNSCYISAQESISIGRNCLIANHVNIRDHDHAFGDLANPIRSQGFIASSVCISDNVWIGAHVVILKGVRIGEGAVIAANSLVTGDVEDYAIYAGSPARLIRFRK